MAEVLALTVDHEATAEARFTGLSGGFKQWATLGVIGVLAGLTCYLVMIQGPAMHTAHLTTIEKLQTAANLTVEQTYEKAAKAIKEEREISRIEAEKSREHGSKAVDKLADGMAANAQAINAMTLSMREEQLLSRETLKEVQGETQKNQRRLIELQEKKMAEDKRIADDKGN